MGNKIHHDQSGFTVFEMIVASVIAGIVMVGVLTFVVNTLVNNSVATARADLLREAQLTLDTIARDMRLSANVEVQNVIEDDNSPNAASTNGFGWESDAGTLILAKAAEDTSGEIIFSDPTNYVTEKNNNVYFVDNSKLYRRILAAGVADNRANTTCPAAAASSTCPADSLLASNVTEFSLRYLNNQDDEVEPGLARSVEVTLGLSTTKYGRIVSSEYVTRTVFRNE